MRTGLTMKSVATFVVFILLASARAHAQTLLRWPLQAAPEYSEVNDYYVINNYVDQNTGTGTLDWNCAARTYEGHRGIDIDIWPFTWSMMNNNSVIVVAAAAGRVAVVDVNNNNENNCNLPGQSLNWNYIAIRHADSSTALYGHLRNNSAKVAMGDMVTAGQPIAIVGSSGGSSNPHLHFEVNSTAVNNTVANNYIEPYSGSCNSLNAVSWWETQKPYFEPGIIRVMTHFGWPYLSGSYNTDLGFCPWQEQKKPQAAFAPNDSIYFGIGMRDFLQSSNHSFNIKVFYPNGSLLLDQTRVSDLSNAVRRAYYVYPGKLPSNAPGGTYKVQVTFNGSTAYYFFAVSCPSTQLVTGLLNGTNGYKTSDVLVSTATVPSGARTLMQAANKITLSPGFAAQSGSAFRARIRDCNYVE